MLRTNSHNDGTSARKIEPKKPRKKREPKVIKLDEKEIRKSKIRNLRFSRVAMTIASTSVVFVLLLLLIQGQVRITELTAQNNNREWSLGQLQSTQVQLDMRAAAQFDAKEIEEYAKTNLSMKKVNNSQITYINIAGENEGIVYAEENTSVFEKILAFFGMGK